MLFVRTLKSMCSYDTCMHWSYIFQHAYPFLECALAVFSVSYMWYLLNSHHWCILYTTFFLLYDITAYNFHLWCAKYTNQALLCDCNHEACPHQLKIAKYPAIWTIPIANYPVNLRLHQPKVANRGYLVEIIIPSYLGLVCKYLSGASSQARRLALCANAEQNILSSNFKFQGQVSSWWRRDL